MALDPGNADCTQGLSRRIWDALARAVVQEIVEAAEVTVAVPRVALGPGLPTAAKTLRGRAR